MTTVKFSKTAERNVEIANAFSAGESKEVLASRFGLTVRTIQRIVAGVVVVASMSGVATAATGDIPASINGVSAGSIQVTGDNNFTGKVYDLNKLDQVDSKADDADFQKVKQQLADTNRTINTSVIPSVSNAVSAATSASTGTANEVKRATAADAKHDSDIAANKTAIADKADKTALDQAVADQGKVDAAQDKLIADNTDASTKAAQAAFTVQGNLTQEETDRKDADTKLQGEIDQNTADIKLKADASALTSKADASALTDEVTRATKAEQANADAITKAVTNQKTTDQNQDTAINNKVSMSAYSNDKVRQLSVDSDQDKAIDTKADKADLTAEVTRAKDAEAKLTTDKADKADVTALQNTQAADHKQIQTNKSEINGVNMLVQDNAQDIKDNKAAQAKVDAAQDTTIKGKVDQTTYDAGQAAQDTLIAGKASQADLTKETNARHADINQMNTRLADKLDVTTYGIDKSIQKTTDAKQTADITTLKGDVAKAATKAQINSLAISTNQKIGQVKTEADQNKTDITANKADIQKNTADIKLKADQTSVDTLSAQQTVNTKNITTVNDKVIKETADRIAADKALTNNKADKADLTKEIADRKAADNNIAVNVNKEGQARIAGDAKLQANIDSNKAASDAYQNQQDTQIAANTNKLTTKVDNTTYQAGLTSQKAVDAKQNADSALKLDKTTYQTGLTKQAATDKAQDTTIATKADSATVTSEVTRATKAEAKLTADKADKSSVVTAQNTANQAVNGLKSKVEQSVYTADKTAQKATDAAQSGLVASKADSSTVTAEVTRAKTAEQANTKLIQGKVDSSVFTADQKRQDTAIANKADKADVNSVHNEAVSAEKHAASNTKLIAKEDQQLTVVSGQVTSNSSSIRAIGQQQKTQGAYIQQQQKTLNNHEQRLNVLEHADHKRNAQVDKNKSDIAENRKQIKAVGNNAAAQASLHFNGNADSWALSTGTYNGDGAAFAGGIQKSITEHAAVSVQFSASDSGDFMAGVGIHGDY
ncbi:TPA: hypothetical protein JG872_000356 [Enterobacter hormaechei subsp. xiangfangensis]|nr:hypothetical protein [Enterobacter hormaechei subsp. xiangfangensis]HAV1860662.1 hypothetical protein [Enterobacter hormaechei subsp. xiangfangensis]